MGSFLLFPEAVCGTEVPVAEAWAELGCTAVLGCPGNVRGVTDSIL